MEKGRAAHQALYNHNRRWRARARTTPRDQIVTGQGRVILVHGVISRPRGVQVDGLQNLFLPFRAHVLTVTPGASGGADYLGCVRLSVCRREYHHYSIGALSITRFRP